MSALLARIAPILIALLTGLVFGGLVGYRYSHNAAIADQSKASAKVAEVVEQKDEAGLAVGLQVEQKREAVKTYFREVRHAAAVLDSHTPTQPVNADCTLDADSVRLWNAANAGPSGTTSSEPNAAVPGTASPDGRQSAGAAGQPHTSGGAVPRLRNEVAGLD